MAVMAGINNNFNKENSGEFMLPHQFTRNWHKIHLKFLLLKFLLLNYYHNHFLTATFILQLFPLQAILQRFFFAFL